MPDKEVVVLEFRAAKPGLLVRPFAEKLLSYAAFLGFTCVRMRYSEAAMARELDREICYLQAKREAELERAQRKAV